MNDKASFRSISEEVSREEWQTRVDLAACYRLVDHYGMTDMIYNHITARVPGPAHHLLINLYVPPRLKKRRTFTSPARAGRTGFLNGRRCCGC
jgi:hypothetical protein